VVVLLSSTPSGSRSSKSGAVPDQDGDEADLHLVEQPGPQILRSSLPA
jgi:hypothetical protein